MVLLLLFKKINEYFNHLLILASNWVNTDRYHPQKQNSTKFKECKEFQYQKV